MIVMCWLALTYDETEQYDKMLKYCSACMRIADELLHIKAEDVFGGENTEAGAELVSKNTPTFRRWLVEALIEMGWAAYSIGQTALAELSAKGALSLSKNGRVPSEERFSVS